MMIVSLNNIESCDSCSMMKAIWKISQQFKIRITKSLKLIHIDLMRFIMSTMNSKWYYILFKNDYNKMFRIFSLKLKDQIYEQYTEYKTLMKNYLESTIKCLWTDNNIEYDNDQFITALKTSDIQWESSAAYMQAQNSKVKCLHCMIMNMIKTVLIMQKLLKMLWVKLMKACCYVQNRVLKVDSQTLYECFKSSKSNLSHLWVLKCKIFVIISSKH